MSKGSGVTRGDRRRNAGKARLRALVPHENAVAGLDLGEKKQALAVTGADGEVLARWSPRVSVHELGPYLDRAVGQARAAGYAGLSVACEPAGSRWMVVQDLCQERGLPFVCVQPLVSHVAREQEDLTGDKTDEGDSGLIARLARELHCYEPERLEGARAELRDEGRRRAQLITDATAAKQLIRGKLGLVAPALLESRASRLTRRPGWRRWRWCWSAAVAGWRRWPRWVMTDSPLRRPLPCPAGAASGPAGPAGSCFRCWAMAAG